MLLGDLINRFEDQGFLADALAALNDLPLAARIMTIAAREELAPGEVVRRSIGRYAATAGHAEWLTLMGLMSRSDNPGATLIRRALAAENEAAT